MWKVPEQGFNDTREKSQLDRFFDNQTKAQALVRESIQNSLDACDNEEKPVQVKFSFNSISLTRFKKYFEGYENNLDEHLKACGKNPNIDNIQYLVIEDFNTKGLTGPIDHMKFDENDEPVTGNFIGFWWSEGISGDKGKGSGGSNGVGKITLSTSSVLNTFIALTKRKDDNKELLLGYSQLKYHSFERKQFKGYARFGKVDNNRIWPYDDNDKKLIREFREDFNLQRTTEKGLSVVIPAIADDIDLNQIVESVLKEYHIPLMNNQLEVQISDRDKEVAINSENIISIVEKYINSSRERELIVYAKEMLKRLETRMIYPKFSTELGEVRKRGIKPEDFHEEDLEKMQAEFTSGQMVGVTIPLEIKQKDTGSDKIITKNSRFHLFIKNEEESKVKRSTNYIRDKFLINKEGGSLIKPYSVAFVYINDAELSEFLKYAEDPGHEKWHYKKLREEYDAFVDDTPLRLIKSSVSDFYNVLSGIGENQTVDNILPEIFSVPEASSGKDDGSNSPFPPENIKSKSVSPFVLSHKKGGFEVKQSQKVQELIDNELIKIPFLLEINMGYEKISGGAIAGYDPLDFDIGDNETFSFAKKSIDILEARGNSIFLKVKNIEFSFVVKGFDLNRDLKIKCKIASPKEV